MNTEFRIISTGLQEQVEDRVVFDAYVAETMMIMRDMLKTDVKTYYINKNHGFTRKEYNPIFLDLLQKLIEGKI